MKEVKVLVGDLFGDNGNDMIAGNVVRFPRKPATWVERNRERSEVARRTKVGPPRRASLLLFNLLVGTRALRERLHRDPSAKPRIRFVARMHCLVLAAHSG